MYQVWSNFLNPGQIAMLGIVVTFLLTFLALKHPFSFLPSDHGREFAVNGGLSRGKLRGVGLVIVICFLIGSVVPASWRRVCDLRDPARLHHAERLPR